MRLVEKTRNLLLLCLAGSLLGCATPQTNPWESVEVPTEVVETPLPCDELPAPEILDEIGQGRIDAMRECAMANYDIANEHAAQIEKMREATSSLVEAGKSQRRIAEMRQEMLEDERQHNMYSSWGYWAVIIGLGVAASD